eukprot:TRINITY_DN3268_c0_g1_i9.p1 TRINITY_DN3268_c0_g1~~TRINITY_DN3268_c0_g1_i9.p1  ORF type:complete len:190 (-),score=42.52 TRINITY_DN3268_c0_g1_i9:117-686(-)
MPPHVRVSSATKASINCSEMDAQLAAALRNTQIRIESTNRTSATFLYGSRETMLDTACEFLSPDLRPVPPQPNCPQSMKIYEDHRQMAAEYLRVKTEMSEMRKYKTELTEKIKQNQELENLSTPTHEDNVQFTQLNSEKEALLAFREKLTEQLTLIEAAQTKKSGSAHSTGGSTDGWVVVNSKPPERNT